MLQARRVSPRTSASKCADGSELARRAERVEKRSKNSDAVQTPLVADWTGDLCVRACSNGIQFFAAGACQTEQPLAINTLAHALLFSESSTSTSTMPVTLQFDSARLLFQTLQPYQRYTPSLPARPTAPGTRMPKATMYHKSPHSRSKSRVSI